MNGHTVVVGVGLPPRVVVVMMLPPPRFGLSRRPAARSTSMSKGKKTKKKNNPHGYLSRAATSTNLDGAFRIPPIPYRVPPPSKTQIHVE